MASTIGTPRSGRLCLLASALFLSVLGRPVAGSFGSFSHTKLPHNAPPQLTIRTWLSFSPVNQVPSASAAVAVLPKVASIKLAVETQIATAVKRRLFMDHHLTLSCHQGRQHSWGGVYCLAYVVGRAPHRGRGSNKMSPKSRCAVVTIKFEKFDG